MGGAESLITGHIVKIENDVHRIRQATGDVTRLKVTEGTNLICRTRPGVSEAKVESKLGVGFRIGDCPFTPEGVRQGRSLKPRLGKPRPIH